MAIGLILMLLLAWCAPARAQGWACWGQAAERYHVNVNLLYAIARVESGMNYQAIGARNRDGSYDIGLMQINSGWLPTLAKYGITEQRLLSDPCLNLNVGAWILSQGLNRLGYNWKGLGAYNAGSNDKRAIYAGKVVSMLRRISREQAAQARERGPASELQIAEAH